MTFFQGAKEKANQDAQLRPEGFGEFVGQEKTQARLKVMVNAARERQSALNHVLLSGPPGLGKTTLAMLLAKEMGVQVKITSGPTIERPCDLAGLLTSLEPRDVLFIDEIHRISKHVEEYLYAAMEDFCIYIMIDQGPNARSVRLDLPPFTLVAATTRTGLLSAPLRSRFTLQTRLDYYPPEQLKKVVIRSAGILNVTIDEVGAMEIARRSRGTPRIANHLLLFARDFMMHAQGDLIDAKMAREALSLLDIDESGLDELDKRVLTTMREDYNGGPVGIGTLAVAVGEERQTLEEVHEPYLIQEGYLKRTAQGRVLTHKGLAWVSEKK